MMFDFDSSVIQFYFLVCKDTVFLVNPKYFPHIFFFLIKELKNIKNALPLFMFFWRKTCPAD